MNREQIGRLLGVLILIVLILGLPYAALSYIFLDGNPADWSNHARWAHIASSAALAAAWLVWSRRR